MYKLYALFNSKTCQFTSFTFDISAFPETIIKTLLFKEFTFAELGLTDEKINLNRFKWIGDYDTGKLIDMVKDKKTVVTEQEIREKYNHTFFNKFKFEDVFYELILNSDMKTENGKAIQSFLIKMLERKRDDIQFYRNSDLHIWETDDDIKKRQSNAFKI